MFKSFTVEMHLSDGYDSIILFSERPFGLISVVSSKFSSLKFDYFLILILSWFFLENLLSDGSVILISTNMLLYDYWSCLFLKSKVDPITFISSKFFILVLFLFRDFHLLILFIPYLIDLFIWWVFIEVDADVDCNPSEKPFNWTNLKLLWARLLCCLCILDFLL